MKNRSLPCRKRCHIACVPKECEKSKQNRTDSRPHALFRPKMRHNSAFSPKMAGKYEKREKRREKFLPEQAIKNNPFGHSAGSEKAEELIDNSGMNPEKRP